LLVSIYKKEKIMSDWVILATTIGFMITTYLTTFF